MDRALVKRWVAGHVAARQRALQVMREEGPLPPDVSFAQSMELADLASDIDDSFREQEVAHARAAWAKLRAWAASRDRR